MLSLINDNDHVVPLLLQVLLGITSNNERSGSMFNFIRLSLLC